MKKIALACAVLIALTSFSSCASKQAKKDSLDDNYKVSIAESQEYPQKKKIDFGNGFMDMANISHMDKENVNLYFYLPEDNLLTPENRLIPKLNKKDFVTMVVQELIRGPKNEPLEPVLSRDTQINSIEETDNILTIDFSSEFLDSNNMLLARTAVANTVTQLEPYKYVNILVEGQILTDKDNDQGSAVGLLAKTTNDVEELLKYELERISNEEQINRINIALYFKDMEGLYLLPEVRSIVYKKGELAKAIVEEVIKGPLSQDEGKCPTIPKGTFLKNIKTVEDESANQKGIELYFSRELKSNLVKNVKGETLLLGSLVMSLSGIPGISFVKVYYEDEIGEPTDRPLLNIPLESRYTPSIFESYIGQRVKVYYGSKKGDSLVTEFRAIAKDDNLTLRNIVNKLFDKPTSPDSEKIMPGHVKARDIEVTIDGNTAVVDLPEEFFMQSGKKVNYVLTLYSIVNSLTDPVNKGDVDEVQFLVDGKIVDNIKGVSLKEPFAGNSGLTK